MDLKAKRILVSLLHSRVVLMKAPDYVVVGMEKWLEQLDRAVEGTEDFTDGFSDTVNVSDHVKVKMNEVN